jgi:hypothetical protein
VQRQLTAWAAGEQIHHQPLHRRAVRTVRQPQKLQSLCFVDEPERFV